jgi:hypothetical protein
VFVDNLEFKHAHKFRGIRLAAEALLQFPL